jgi:hypothetical protein
MRPNGFLLSAAFVGLLLCGVGVQAEIVQAQNVKVDVPSAWLAMPSASARSVRLKSPDRRIEVTVFVHSPEATKEGSLEELAQRFLDAEHQTQKRIAKGMGADVAQYKSSVDRDGARWYAQSATRLTSGLELRGLTILERGRAVSVGADSQQVGQPELESAIRLIVSRITE